MVATGWTGLSGGGGAKVGKFEGAALGEAEGDLLGLFDGAAEGLVLGASEGLLDGAVLGREVGAPVGELLGALEGAGVELDVGLAVVGAREGEAVGLVLGAADGLLLGWDVGGRLGWAEGADEGAPVVGEAVGRLDGLKEGDAVGAVGALLGVAEGALDGCRDGAALGREVGALLGLADGVAVGLGVGGACMSVRVATRRWKGARGMGCRLILCVSACHARTIRGSWVLPYLAGQHPGWLGVRLPSPGRTRILATIITKQEVRKVVLALRHAADPKVADERHVVGRGIRRNVRVGTHRENG